MPIATGCLLSGPYLVLAGQTSTDEMLTAAVAAATATLFAVSEISWLRIVGDSARALMLDDRPRLSRHAVSVFKTSKRMVATSAIST